MRDCEFCGGPRVNGTPIVKKHGEWRQTIHNTPDSKFACRDCAKERIKG